MMRRVHQLAIQTVKRSISIVRVAKCAPKVSFNNMNVFNAKKFSTEVDPEAPLTLSESLAHELEVYNISVCVRNYNVFMI